MSHFQTESDVMVMTAGRVDSTNDQVQGELVRLRGIVDGTRASWVGSAQASFDALMQRWNTAAVDLNTALQSIAENIRANARTFDAGEEENLASFQQIGGGLAL
ncbi:MAG: WXG100 family type VII secretion target [Corynebacterium sp.]|nr:WXG100 family type VII secretion target [Corynebacterium sp.]